jgi:hypothetical protein
MGRRRRDDGLEGLIGLIAVILFLFGTVIIAFLKALLVVLLIVAGTALVCFVLYRIGRTLWKRQLDTGAYLPSIDWSLPTVSKFDNRWLDIRYPEFTAPSPAPVPRVIGTSGAWKDVLGKLGQFPCLRSASGPQDLQQRVSACEAAAPDILRQASNAADEMAREKQADLQQQVQRLQDAEKILDGRVRPKLETFERLIEAMSSSHYLDRLRATRLRSRLSQYEIELNSRRREVREEARRQEQAIRNFLDPACRERTLQEKIQYDLAGLKGVVASKEFAGAVAEVAVIEELSSLGAGSLILNDLKIESGRYIRFEGKPLMSAQIDTLAITTAGLFVIEVKNWSRQFARSGEGFNPYEQVSRASYLVFNRLRGAGFKVRVQAIIATDGSLPERGKHKVAVVPISRLRRYIQAARARQVDISAVKRALGY